MYWTQWTTRTLCHCKNNPFLLNLFYLSMWISTCLLYIQKLPLPFQQTRVQAISCEDYNVSFHFNICESRRPRRWFPYYRRFPAFEEMTPAKKEKKENNNNNNEGEEEEEEEEQEPLKPQQYLVFVVDCQQMAL